MPKARKQPLIELRKLSMAAESLRVLAHPHRLRFVEILLTGKYRVGELADACGVVSPVASEHLRLLQRSGLLTAEKQGRVVYYRVADPFAGALLRCIQSGFGS